MIRHWKRVVELASPLLIALVGYLNVPVTFGPVRWYTLPLWSPYWIHACTAVAWIAAVISLRPLSATDLTPHRRFGFIAALIAVIALGLPLVRAVHNAQLIGPSNEHVFVAFIPAGILAWGVRERLKDRSVPAPGRCSTCG